MASQTNTINLNTYKAKILSNTFGANNSPVYFNDGVPTILTTIGGQYEPVWVNNGVITAITAGTTAQFYRGDKSWSNEISGGLFKITNNNNTVTIGSNNANYCHFSNSADIPFYFNKLVWIEGNLQPYGTTSTKDLGTSSQYWKDAYITTTHGDLNGNADTATKVKVTNLAFPSSGSQTYYLTLAGSTTTGNQDIKDSDHLYLYENTTTSYLNVGSSGTNGGLTLWKGTGHVDIVPTTITANTTRNQYLPNVTGWIAVGGNGSSTGAGGQYAPVYLSTSGVLTEITAGTTSQFYRGDKTWSSTLANILTLYREGTTANDYAAGIAFTNKDTTTGSSATSILYVYNDHSSSSAGNNMVISPGGALILGGGEGPNSLYGAIKSSIGTGEHVYLVSDNTTYIYSNSQTVANRIGIAINTSGHVIPQKAEAANNNAQNLGASDNKWASVYATTLDASILKLHQGTGANPSLTGNARIEFDYTGGQPVVISYTPEDAYRAPAGLKVMGGTSATPAWFEVEGELITGKRQVTSGPSSITYANRLTIVPYFHTGGPWYIKSGDDASNAYLALYYNSSQLMRIKHDGTQMLDWKGNATTATTATKLGTATVGSSSQPIYLNAGTATGVSWYFSSCTINGGNKANYPWHRFAYVTTGGGTYTDKDVIVIIRARFDSGRYGMIKLSTRTNGSGAAKSSSATWIYRKGFEVGDVIISKPAKTTGTDETISAYVKCSTYPRCLGYIVQGSNNGWTLVSSNEPNDTTASDKKGGTEINASVSNTQAATDGATVSYANSAGSASSVAWTNVSGRPTIDKTTVIYQISRGATFDPIQSGYFAGMTQSSGITGDWWHILSMDWSGDNKNDWISQLALPTQSRKGIYYRTRHNSTTNAWIKCLDADNYTDYTVTKTGSGASGTWGISITGNAANVTGTVAVGNGGTGKTSWTKGGIVYASATNTLAQIADGSADKVLRATASATYSWLSYTSAATASTIVYRDGSKNFSAGTITATLSGNASSATRIKDNLSAASGSVNHNIWVSSTASADGIPRYVSNCYINESGYLYATRVYNAVWNDYAECRQVATEEPGYCVTETSNGIMMKTYQRLQPGCKITSDTFGTCMGETANAKVPVAVAGRVLVHTYRNRSEYPLGAAVCSAPNGTVDIMTRDEIMMYPERVVGTVSEIPNYEVWHGGNQDGKNEIQVNGRIWIYVR